MKRTTLFDILLLAVITVVAYFPVSMFIFSLKNDSLAQYLPFRYHLSESIQHGYFPLWNTYLYTGFPIHADMQGMTWNPIVLLISLVTRYNMTVLEIEVMIYLVLAAIGMYWFLKSFKLRRIICLLGAISYMSCGFINGSASVIPWISSAAFIPFVFVFFKQLLENITWTNSILFGGSLSLLFLCGYPTFFIYTCYILFAVLVFAAILNYRKKIVPINLKTISIVGTSIFIFLLICSPAILSYVDFLPYYSRGSGITAAKAAENPFPPFSSLSFLFPNVVTKEHPWLDTDPSMRNHYVGLFVFLLFVYSLFGKKDKQQKLILTVTVVSFLLSLGSFTPVHRMFYSVLPLFDTFRHPANIRLFASIGIILLAAVFTQTLFSIPKSDLQNKFLRLSYLMLACLLIALISSFLIEPAALKILLAALQLTDPKQVLDNISFSPMLLIQSLLQIALVSILISHLKRQEWNKKILAALFTANSLLFCWIALPDTFISQVKTKDVNQYLAIFPDGYPLPDMDSGVEAHLSSDSIKIPVYGYPNFYSKKITIQDHIITPTLNKDYETFLDNKTLRMSLKDYPFAWLRDPVNKGTVTLTSLTPNKIIFEVRSDSSSELNIFQQYNHNWKARVNGDEVPVYKRNIAFMAVRVNEGNSRIELNYQPRKVIISAWLSLIVLVLLLGYLAVSSIRRKSTHE